MADRLSTTHAEYYDGFYADQDYEGEVEFMIAESGRREGRVLVLGCGTGEHVRYFEEKGWEAVGTDASARMIDIAESKCDAEFHRQTLPEIDLDGAFDLIVLAGGLICYFDPQFNRDVLRNAREYLRDGGTIVVDHPLASLGEASLPLQPWIEVNDDDGDMYARAVQMQLAGETVEGAEAKYVWNAMYFVQRETFEFFVESHPHYVYEHDHVEALVEPVGLRVSAVQTYVGGKYPVYTIEPA